MLFNVLNDVRYYEQRESADRRKRIVRNVLEDWLIILSPIVPHICEEVWHKLHDTFISVQTLPAIKVEFIDDRVEQEEEYLVALIGDIKEILKIARIKPAKIYVYTAENWKREIFRAIKDVPDKDKIKEAMKIRKDNLLSTVDFVKQVMKNLSFKKKALPKKENTLYFELDEAEVLEREKGYLATEFGCEILVNEEYDPKGKKRFAIPLKPAIFVVG
jgi:leucyl-tRNA synthetase